MMHRVVADKLLPDVCAVVNKLLQFIHLCQQRATLALIVHVNQNHNAEMMNDR